MRPEKWYIIFMVWHSIGKSAKTDPMYRVGSHFLRKEDGF